MAPKMSVYRNLTISTLFGAIILLFCACEADLKIDGLQTQSKLVVNSVFSPDSTWTVHVSKTRNIFTESKNAMTVDHAEVAIVDLETGEQIDLISQGEGLYSVKLLKPIPGREYEISVKADGFEDVFARDETPFPVEVNFVKEEVIEHNGSDVLKVDFEIIDKGGQENYYVWELVVTKIDQEEEGGSEIKDVALIGSLDTNIDDSANGVKEQKKLFITDLTFDGSNYNTSFYTDPGFEDGQSEGEDDPNIVYEKELHISVISKNYYLYLRSLELYENSGNTSSTVSQPAEIFTNIENGLGIFGGFYQMKIDF